MPMLLATLALCAAQVDFDAAPIVTGSLGAPAIAVGDLTPAPGLEIVFASHVSVRIAERDAVTGAWRDTEIEGAPKGALWLEVLDVDADGRNDIVLLGSGGGVLFNDTTPGAPSPSFTWVAWNTVSPYTNIGTTLAGLGDIDGNGLPDVVLGPNFSLPFGLSANLQVAPRTFAPPIDLPTGTFVMVKAADIDGDGDLDLLSYRDGWVATYENVGGTWSAATPRHWQPGTERGLLVVDLDGDGALDVIALSATRLVALANDGTGSLTPGATATVPDVLLLAHLDLVDMDGDGDLDLVVRPDQGTDWWHWRAQWFERTGPFEFAGTARQVLPGAPFVAEARVVDIDGDGVTDAVTVTGSSPLRLYMGTVDPSGAFALPTTPEEPVFGPVFAGQARMVDLDGDGDLDVVTAERSGLWLTEQRAPGVFHNAQRVPLPLETLNQAVEVTRAGGLAAVTRDGVLFATDHAPPYGEVDLAVLATGIGSIQGSFVFLDHDADGDEDIAALSADGLALLLIERLGASGWAAPVTLATAPAGTTYQSIVRGDWNGDGRDDLVACESTPSAFALRTFLASGGTLAPSASALSLAGAPLRIQGAPTRTPGVDEVVVLEGDAVTAWEVNAQGALGAPSVIAAGLQYADDFDLARVQRGVGAVPDQLLVLFGTTVRRFRLDPSGAYLEIQPLEGQPPANGSVRGVDVDGDGDVDTLLLGGNVDWWRSELQPDSSAEYCLQPSVNSRGLAAELRAVSRREVTPGAAGIELRLDVFGLPAGAPGLLLAGRIPSQIPAASGTLCIRGPIGRFDRPGELFTASRGGAFGRAIDTNDLPLGGTSVMASFNETWCFQAWYRDGLSSRFTSALAVQF